MQISLGELHDRLSIVNIKLWHVQERVYGAAASASALSNDDVRALTHLNLERTSYINAINKRFGEGSPIVKIT